MDPSDYSKRSLIKPMCAKSSRPGDSNLPIESPAVCAIESKEQNKGKKDQLMQLEYIHIMLRGNETKFVEYKTCKRRTPTFVFGSGE